MSKLIRSMQIPQMMVQKYERYLPTAFDESLSLLQKVNKIHEFLNLVITHINEVTETTNDIVNLQNDKINELSKDFNDLNEWARGEGLELSTSTVLNEWLNDGTLADIINNEVLGMKVDQTEFDDSMKSVNQQLAQTGKYIANVPAVTATEIENYLNDCEDGSIITFPKNATFTLDRQIALMEKHNLTINFNGCTFILQSNLNLSSRNVTVNATQYSLGRDILTLVECTNITFNNLVLDGNRANNTQEQLSGLRFENTQKFYGNNLKIKSYNDKLITIRNNSTKIFFDVLELSDKGEATSGAYIFSSTLDGEYHINNCIVEGIVQYNINQFLYSAGGIWFINNIQINNMRSCFDLRRGRAYIDHVKVNNCGIFAITQPYPDYPGDPYPFISIKNAEVNDCNGTPSGNTGCFIVSGGMELENVVMNMSTTSENALSGITIRKLSPEYLVAPSKFKNITINNAISYGVNVTDSEASIEIKKSHFNYGGSQTASTSAINITSTFTGSIVLDNCTHSNYYQLNTETEKLIKLENLIARTFGTTAQRPTFENYRHQGFQYFDTTLGQPIWWAGQSWKDGVGSTV